MGLKFESLQPLLLGKDVRKTLHRFIHRTCTMSSPSHLLHRAACIGFLAASLFLGGESVYSQTSPTEAETPIQVEAEAGSLQRSSANSPPSSPHL